VIRSPYATVIRYRSAITGEYVTEGFAVAHPRSTVEENYFVFREEDATKIPEPAHETDPATVEAHREGDEGYGG